MAARADTRVYVVRAGDTLGALARCSGVPLANLARDNGIPDANVVYEGEKLRLPAHHSCDRETDRKEEARAHAGSLLKRASARLDAADFEQALALASECARALSAFPGDPRANALRVRCHVVAGTAATGLDNEERALSEFRRALAVDPRLELDPATTSPRVRELVATARSNPKP